VNAVGAAALPWDGRHLGATLVGLLAMGLLVVGFLAMGPGSGLRCRREVWVVFPGGVRHIGCGHGCRSSCC
ncbi:hypothetical protein AB4212_65155, partial [Streptomyces sp. 2MCAF27]